MGEDQGFHRQMPARAGAFLENFVTLRFEQLYRLFAFQYQIWDEQAQVQVRLQHIRIIGENCVQQIVDVRQQVQYEWWGIFEIQTRLLATTNDGLHQSIAFLNDATILYIQYTIWSGHQCWCARQICGVRRGEQIAANKRRCGANHTEQWTGHIHLAAAADILAAVAAAST